MAFRFSRKFSDTFGDDIADEFVNWFNHVDTAYHADLRELNERNFERFDAKLEQRIGEVRSELSAEIADVRSDLKSEIAVLRAEMHAGFSAIRAEMTAFKAELIKWMFLFWLGTTATTVAVVGLAG